MVAKLIYALVFIAAFVVTTATLMYLNSKYENIFKFDFSPASLHPAAASVQPEKGSAGAAGVNEKKEAEKGEQAKDSVQAQPPKEEMSKAQADSLKKLQLALDASKQKLAEKDKELKTAQVAEQARKDSAYTKWKKDIVKTYDKMDPRAVAKIIMKMNDNYARDILFTLKDKKRAQIIQIILDSDPEVASKLTKVP